MLSALPLTGLPEVCPGDELASLLAKGLPVSPEPGDILVVAHKIVSKAEGRMRALDEVRPSRHATELATKLRKDARHVQVVLDESEDLLRAQNGVLICVTRHGFVCANAGVDASNSASEGTLILLPEDPDSSARRLRARLRELTGTSLGVVITDSFGRAWRHGQVDVAIGCAGLWPLEDWRGRADSAGRQLRATWIAVADELAAAADLVRGKDSAEPAVLIRGAGRYVIDDDGPGAAALVRPEAEDLFR